MEILQHSLKVEIETLTSFELKVWNILSSLFKSLIEDHLSDESSIEKGLGIDVFLKVKRSDFVLYLSITEDRYYINSKYFDIYLYPETKIDKIELLSREILLGNYSIRLGYGNHHNLVSKELIFDKKELKEFNENKKIGFFTKKIKEEKNFEGIKLICD